jgi:hypothetical protein
MLDKTYLSKSGLVLATEEGSSICQKRLNLLLDSSNSLFGQLLLLFTLCLHQRVQVALNLCVPGIDEESQSGSEQRSKRVVQASGQQMRRTGVCEELCDNARLGDDFLIVEAGDCVLD